MTTFDHQSFLDNQEEYLSAILACRLSPTVGNLRWLACVLLDRDAAVMSLQVTGSFRMREGRGL